MTDIAKLRTDIADIVLDLKNTVRTLRVECDRIEHGASKLKTKNRWGDSSTPDADAAAIAAYEAAEAASAAEAAEAASDPVQKFKDKLLAGDDVFVQDRWLAANGKIKTGPLHGLTQIEYLDDNYFQLKNNERINFVELEPINDDLMKYTTPNKYSYLILYLENDPYNVKYVKRPRYSFFIHNIKTPSPLYGSPLDNTPFIKAANPLWRDWNPLDVPFKLIGTLPVLDFIDPNTHAPTYKDYSKIEHFRPDNPIFGDNKYRTQEIWIPSDCIEENHDLKLYSGGMGPDSALIDFRDGVIGSMVSIARVEGILDKPGTIYIQMVCNHHIDTNSNNLSRKKFFTEVKTMIDEILAGLDKMETSTA